MSDEQLSVEDKARQLGWAAKEEWRGSPDNWVDAEEFVRRGETILPILKKNSESMHQTIARLEAQVSNLAGQVSAGQESMKAMEELHARDVQRQVERAKTEIKQQLIAAREAGDTDAEMTLMDQLSEVNGQLKAIKDAPAPAQAKPPGPPPLDEATKSWLSQNPWFEKEPRGRKAKMAIAISEEFLANGRRLGESFYKDLDTELSQLFGDGNPRREGASKVEGGRAEGGSSTSKGYAALPADAKAECDKDVKRLVGDGRRFKTADEYRAYYAKLYFSEE